MASAASVLHEVPDDDGAYAPMLTAARLCYEDDLSQEQIADRLRWPCQPTDPARTRPAAR
jgi:hypothetical protein